MIMAENDALTPGVEKKGILEAALFMSPDPLGIDKLSNLIGMGLSDTLAILNELIQEYQERPGVEIVRIEGGKYKMQVRAEYLPYVKDLATTLEMSKAVLRTLALIAFRQPIKQSDVVKIRGNKAYDHIKELMDKGFVKSRKHRNTLLLETTRKFEEYFGPVNTKLPADQRKLVEYEDSGDPKQDNMGQDAGSS